MTRRHTLPPTATRTTLALAMDAELMFLHRQARRLTRTDAEAQDLVQDTVERALRFADTFEPGTNLRAWLRQILRSVFVSRCRRVKRERLALELLSHDPCAWTRPEPEPDMRRLSPGVHRALESLPPKFNTIVRRVDIDGLSYREAADEIGVPVGTVMSRLFRARRMLAGTLAAGPVLRAA